MLKELGREEYKKRAQGATHTAVFKEYLADRETPVAVLSRLGEDEEMFLLESVHGAERRGRYSYIGIDPQCRLEGPDALEKLRERFAAMKYVRAPELPSFQGGAAGYVAYDAVKLFEPKVGLREEPGTPPFSLLMIDKFLVFDNVSDTVTVVVVVENGAYSSADDAYDSAMVQISAIYERVLSAESIARLMAKRVAALVREEPQEECAEFASEMTKEEFCGMVEKCKAAIRDGEAIQIVPSQKFTVRTGIGALPLYRALRMINPSPYNFMMRLGEKTLIGSSPEELVKLEDRTAEAAPIAGTRPRGSTREEDAMRERELLACEKERAEHVMLVDLARNDLGRVCETGSVRVDSFAHIERYSHVMHIVSNVKGRLAAGTGAFDLLKSVFPAGTLSGAPKVRAMQLIAEFEKSPRGIYGGAAGYFSFTGDMDLAIVIRTMILEKGLLTMRSGAGIVADSDPEKEFDETINKAKAVFEAVKAARRIR